MDSKTDDERENIRQILRGLRGIDGYGQGSERAIDQIAAMIAEARIDERRSSPHEPNCDLTTSTQRQDELARCTCMNAPRIAQLQAQIGQKGGE